MTNDTIQAKIDRIRAVPKLTRDVVAGLNDAQLDTPYGPGKWTVRQVVHHLADSHMNGYGRMKLVLTEDHPTLKNYEQERWAETHEACAVPIESSIAILGGLHERWCLLLESLDDSAWDRTANHPEVGEIKLATLLDIYAAHGENHVAQIRSLRTANDW